MSLPRIVTRDEWLAARTQLLAEEKELTQRRDALSTKRRELPMVPIEKDYVFEDPKGPVGLVDLFDGRRQLIIYHFMFHPEWDEGCSSCTAGTDEISSGFLEHLHVRDTTYAMVSRAPLEKLERWKQKKGWELRWYSSFGSAKALPPNLPCCSNVVGLSPSVYPLRRGIFVRATADLFRSQS